MKKILLFLPLLFSMNLCVSQQIETGSIFKLMNLVKDAQLILEQGDPYAIQAIVEKIVTEIKYVNFNDMTNYQFKQITDLIIANITTRRDEIQHGMFLFINSFLDRANQFITLFLIRKDIKNVMLRFASNMLKTLPKLMKKNPKFVNKLLKKFKTLTSGLTI